MAAERFVRGPVDREDGIAKTFPSDYFSLRVPGMSQGRFVWLYNPSSLRDLLILYYIPNKSLYLGCNKSLYLDVFTL